MINLSPKDSERYNELFKKLDTNSDGKIDVNDLVTIFNKYEKTDKTETKVIDKNSVNNNPLVSRARVNLVNPYFYLFICSLFGYFFF